MGGSCAEAEGGELALLHAAAPLPPPLPGGSEGAQPLSGRHHVDCA